VLAGTQLDVAAILSKDGLLSRLAADEVVEARPQLLREGRRLRCACELVPRIRHRQRGAFAA